MSIRILAKNSQCLESKFKYGFLSTFEGERKRTNSQKLAQKKDRESGSRCLELERCGDASKGSAERIGH